MTVMDDLTAFAIACRRKRAALEPIPMPISASLTGTDLRGINLRGINLSGADLTGADLRSVDLRYANLTNTNLTNANLTGTDLTGTDLRYAKLTGVLVAEGIVDTYLAGVAGKYMWYALRLQDGSIILQYGCERHMLAVWLSRSPEYGAYYGHDPAHWATGPAVAIEAAVALS